MSKQGRKNIVWLASYPKSGNTWFRMFLANLLSRGKSPQKLNNILKSDIASSRDLFDETTGISASELTHNEADNLRPWVYRHLSYQTHDIQYKKIHDAYILTPSGEALIPADTTKAVLYLIRNPFDVAVSFANHLQVSVEKAIEVMEDKDYAFCHKVDRVHHQLRQKLLSWSGHVNSWTTGTTLPIMPVRYEDMFFDPFNTFKKASRFIGLTDYTDTQIKQAIQHADFSLLQKQEEEEGFNEKPQRVTKFFRRGIVGDFKEHMTNKQIQQIIDTHGVAMQKFGYLDKNGKCLV